MLLTNPRHRLIYFCLTGMELAWIVPLFLLIYPPARERSPLVLYLLFFAILLGWLLILDLLNRFVLKSPPYELAVLLLIGLSSLLFVRLFAYPNRPFFDLSWPVAALLAMVRFDAGIPLPLLVMLVNFFLWLRASSATSREIDFWNVGLSFRLGMLLLIAMGGVLYHVSHQSALLFLWLYFTFGLTAVALTRVDAKAVDARSSGRLLPSSRLWQLLLTVGGTVGLTAWLASFYTPANLRLLLSWLAPLWEVLVGALLLLLTLIFWILEPLLVWLSQILVNMFANIDLSGFNKLLDSFREALAVAQTQGQGAGVTVRVPLWVWTSLRYLGLVLLLLPFLGLIFIFLDRVRQRHVLDQREWEGAERVTLGGNSLLEGLRRLRGTAGLVRRYGLSRNLLAAISAENIYANLCRIARRQGYPRRPAQPPDDYLPVLREVFAGQGEALGRITVTYMRVYYGDQPLDEVDLRQLRRDYQQVRQVKPTGRSS